MVYNKGTDFPIAGSVAALCIAAYKAWPDMKANAYFTGGAILFYVLVALIIGSIVHLILASRKKIAPPAMEGNAAASYHEARAGEFKEQVDRLTKERDHLLSEQARINQHRVDLLGTLAQAKEAKQPSALSSPPETVSVSPRITYLGSNLLQSQREDMPLGNQVRIAFRNDCGHAISVSQLSWDAGAHGLHAYILGHVLHDARSQWNPGHNSLDLLHVDPAAVFDVWVGITRDYSLVDLKNRLERKILGVLSLTIDAHKEAVFEL